MGVFFIGTEDGNSASGYIVANGNVYPAVSGSSKFRDIPEGTHNYGSKEHPKKSQWTMTDAKNKAAGAARASSFWKWHIGPDKNGGGTIHDDRSFTTPEGNSYPNGGEREGVDFHWDGAKPGTAGCIGFQDRGAEAALDADPDQTVQVEYMADDAAMKAEIEKRLGACVDWSKVKAPNKPASAGGGTQLKTKKGTKVDKAHSSLLIGPQYREFAHQQAMLQGGGCVTQGNGTLLIGPEKYPASCVEHMTTDGSPIGNGEDSVLMLA